MRPHGFLWFQFVYICALLVIMIRLKLSKTHITILKKKRKKLSRIVVGCVKGVSVLLFH